MTAPPFRKGELILYQTEDGRTPIERCSKGEPSIPQVIRAASEIA